MPTLRTARHAGVLIACAVVLAACSDALPSATPTPIRGNCGNQTANVAVPPQSLVLAPADVPATLHEVSAQPIKMPASPAGEPAADSSYQVVFADSSNSRRVVSQVEVANSPANAALFMEGADTRLTANGGRQLGDAGVCPGAELATTTENGKQVYVVSWRHDNVFAEVVVYHSGAGDADAITEVKAFATTQEVRIAATRPSPTPPSGQASDGSPTP